MKSVKFSHTGHSHYKAPQYSAVFNIMQPFHGFKMDYFAICLL